MIETMARNLAWLIGGKPVRMMPRSRTWGVALTRADGRYALVEEDAGAIYFDEHACWVGYQACGSDPKGSIEAAEWIEWSGTERWARGLAEIIGGRAHQSGGNIWVVVFGRADGRLAWIGDDGGSIFTSEAAIEHEQDTAEYRDFFPAEAGR